MVALQHRPETEPTAQADSATRFLNRAVARIPNLDARLTCGARVLFLGCHDVALIERMLARYPLIIATAVDDDSTALEPARARLGDRVTLVECGPDAFESDRAFDLVLAHNIHGRGADIDRLAAHAFAALRPRGTFVLSDNPALEGRDVALLDRLLFWDVSAFNLTPDHRLVHGSR